MYILSIFQSLVFYQMNNPLIMCLILITQCFLICLMINWIANSFWFSFILFIVFIGGILILFIYIISMIFKEKFIFIYLKNLTFNMKISLSFFILMISLNYKSLLVLNNNENLNMKFKLLFNENSLHLLKSYNFQMNIITLFLINYLLFLLIVSAKITNFNKGPIRLKFYK